MLAKTEDLIHQKQTCSKSCAVACIAMVTKHSFSFTEEYCKLHGFDMPLSARKIAGLLVKNDVYLLKVDNILGTAFEPYRIHFISVVKNDAVHVVVCYLNGDGIFWIFDPDKNEPHSVDFLYEIGTVVSIEALYDCSSGEAV